MAPTPSPRPGKEHATPSKTPHSKHRLHFPGGKTPNAAAVPSPLPSLRENSVPTEHPVEVIGRIRDYPDRKEKPPSALEIAEDGRSVRVRTDIGYRDFTLDGVSVSGDEDLEEFYSRFVETRVQGVRVGAKCTIMMYGPTGAGKSHTMFGCPKQPGIVYRALRDILGEWSEENSAGADTGGFGVGLFVQVAVLEIYNEEIYDLLSGYTGGGGATGGFPKGSTPKVRLEIMGKKAKNATYISGNEAGKISKEVAKVEKRRIVKSTLCNDRSSRSHCLIILDVPSVGGRLMLVDMAGSENIEQAGQNGFEAKMQTAKINQGNTALKRVVESIANGDSHVPFRDSKLTMLLQDSFEDDKSKILMILCASPDPAEMHRTLSTLEYGAKAKCIVRAAHMATPCKTNSEESTVVLSSRIVAMNQFIFKLQMENKLKEKERDEAQRELARKEEEVGELRGKLLGVVEEASAVKEEEIESKVDERTRFLRVELEKMEKRMRRQEEELETLRQRVVEMESGEGKVVDGDCGKLDEAAVQDISARFVSRLSAMCCAAADQDAGMEKSMELDLGDSIVIHDVREVRGDGDGDRDGDAPHHRIPNLANSSSPCGEEEGEEEEGDDALMSRFPEKVFLSTVFEGEEGEEELESGDPEEEEEVEKEVIEENSDRYGSSSARDLNFDAREDMDGTGGDASVSARRTRIQNIFRLCGNHRELAQQVRVPTTHTKRKPCGDQNPPLSSPMSQSKDPKADDLDEQRSTETKSPKGRHRAFSDKENSRPTGIEKAAAAGAEAGGGGVDDIYVKWEASKDVSSAGNLKKLQVLNNSTLADLRKSIETHLSEENSKQDFTFLLLGDPTGAPVAKEKEATTQVGRLPICNNQLGGHLACLRPSKTANQQQLLLPFSPLENKVLVPAVNSPSNMDFLTGFRV